MAYIGRVNDPLLQQDPVTASTLNGATIEARNMGQEPVWTSQMESQQPLDPNLAKGMAYLYNDVIGKLAQANQQQPTVQPEQQAPILVQGLMPALVDGAEYQARPTVDEVQAQPQQRVPLNQMAKMYADQIVQAKGLYGEAEQAGNAEAMAYAHNAAEQARAGLQQLGVDPEAYGLNGTYQEAQQAMASNNLQAMNNVLNGEFSESSGMYYDRIYKILRDQGFSRDIAEREAHNRAENYSSRRMQALGQTFEMYGHDPTTINPMGVQLLGMMAQEDMDMANYYTQRYAGPLQEYAKANQRENAAIQHQYKSEDRAADQKNALERIGYQGQVNAQLKQIDAAQKEAYARNRFVESVQLAGIKASINAATKGKNNNGYTQEQAKLAHDGIKEINRQLENNMNLSDADKQDLMNQRAQLQAIINAYEGIGQKDNGSVLSGVDVNDFNSLSEAYQKIVERNAAAYEKNDPNDPPMSWDELNRAFLAEAGEDNPMALNIVENSPYKTGSSSSGAASTSAPARPSAPQVVYLPADESGDNPGGYADDTGTRGSIPIVGFLRDTVGNIAQDLRANPIQTRAGEEAKRKYGLE